MYIRCLLKRLYLKQKLSIHKIELQTNLKNVSKLLDKYKITKRTPKENFYVHIVGACKKHRDPNIDYYSNIEKLFEDEILVKQFNLEKNKDFFHDKYLPPTKCQADFFIPSKNLDIEIDGLQWHKKDSTRRDTKLKNLLNITVIRFNDEDLKNLDIVTNKMKEFIK